MKFCRHLDIYEANTGKNKGLGTNPLRVIPLCNSEWLLLAHLSRRLTGLVILLSIYVLCKNKISE